MQQDHALQFGLLPDSIKRQTGLECLTMPVVHHIPPWIRGNAAWVIVDIQYRQTFKTSLSLDRLRQEPKLKGMVLLQKGSRLSVQPVTEAEWAVVLKLAGAK